MKMIYLILAFIDFFYSCNVDRVNKAKEPGVVIKAVSKGSYNFPQNGNNYSYRNDSTYYFLVDVKLFNNTDKSIQFVTYFCTTISNVVLDSKNVRTCINNCGSNSITIIELKPKQEFSLPVILQTNMKNAYSQIKIGWIFLPPKRMDIHDVSKLLDESRKKLENVIWSEPLELNPASGQLYEIK